MSGKGESEDTKWLKEGDVVEQQDKDDEVEVQHNGDEVEEGHDESSGSWNGVDYEGDDEENYFDQDDDDEEH